MKNPVLCCIPYIPIAKNALVNSTKRFYIPLCIKVKFIPQKMHPMLLILSLSALPTLIVYL